MRSLLAQTLVQNKGKNKKVIHEDFFIFLRDDETHLLTVILQVNPNHNNNNIKRIVFARSFIMI